MNDEKFNKLKEFFISNNEFYLSVDLNLFNLMKDIENIIKDFEFKVDFFQKELEAATAIQMHNNNGIVGTAENRKPIKRTRETGF